MLEILLDLLPVIISFVIGLVLKSPIYQKGKKLLTLVAEALQDDKLTAEELQKIVDAFNQK